MVLRDEPMTRLLLPVLLLCVPLTIVRAQHDSTAPGLSADGKMDPAATESESGLTGNARQRLDELAGRLDQNRTVQDLSKHLLNPIDVASDACAFPAFHWMAFALMSAGVVSYALQLVLSKVIVLARGSFDVRAVMSDVFGLLMSGIGLMLTTQAAAGNSAFSERPIRVLSAAAVGIVAGLILYRWNHAEELEAAYGRQKKKRRRK